MEAESELGRPASGPNRESAPDRQFTKSLTVARPVIFFRLPL